MEYWKGMMTAAGRRERIKRWRSSNDGQKKDSIDRQTEDRFWNDRQKQSCETEAVMMDR